MIRHLNELSPQGLGEAHHATETLLSDKFRPYIQGRMLPLLLAKFHDDVRDALGMEPERRLPSRERRQPGMLTDAELDMLTGSVVILQDRLADYMDDPALPTLLGDFRAILAAEKAERTKIRAAFGKEEPAKAS
jgi:hypothetical protein